MIKPIVRTEGGSMLEKMSKSKGNAISTDEVVHGVASLAPGYEFRYADGVVMDNPVSLGVWMDPDDFLFYTATRFGKTPVFLHIKEYPIPALLSRNNETRIQHCGKAAYVRSRFLQTVLLILIDQGRGESEEADDVRRAVEELKKYLTEDQIRRVVGLSVRRRYFDVDSDYERKMYGFPVDD